MRRFDAVLPLAALLLLSQRVPAEVIDYQQLIQSHPDLIHRYSFDGDSAERLQDQQGSAHLNEKTRGSNVVPISFIPGFTIPGRTATSNAVLTTRHPTEVHNGAGLTTADADLNDFLSLPSTLTVEALFRPDEDTLPTGTNHAYIVTSRPASESRGYFVMQSQVSIEGTDKSRLRTNIGSDFESDGEVEFLLPLTPGNWYYTAATYEVDTASDTTTITAYIADLTGGDATLNPLGSKTVQGSYLGDAPLTIGLMSDAAYDTFGYQHFFPGAIDEVALYSALLDQPTLQSHLTAILVPEPSAFALLAAGSLALMGFRRRRAR